MPGDQARPRVLVVEDEPRLRDLLVQELPEMGFDPVPAASAEAGLRTMRDAACDVVLLDLNLPGMGGLAFLERLREGWGQVPVVVMTGYGSVESAQSAIRGGVVDFLTKPARLGEIEAALGRARRAMAERHRAEVFEHPPLPPEVFNAPDEACDLSQPPRTLAELERRAIRHALESTGGNRTAAAKRLGISRRTLYNKLAEYGIE